MVKTVLAAITATVLLASSAAPSSAQFVIEEVTDMADGMVDHGTGEPEPLLVSVLGSASLAGL